MAVVGDSERSSQGEPKSGNLGAPEFALSPEDKERDWQYKLYNMFAGCEAEHRVT